jgi:hypothetical protein
MKRIKVLLLLPILFLTGCRQRESPPPGNGVSIIQLIANPHEYDEKTVTVIGYLSLRFEGTALYLHESDYEKYVFPNAIAINLGKTVPTAAEQALEGHCVLLDGRFDADVHGHLGVYPGTISDISRLIPWPPATLAR